MHDPIKIDGDCEIMFSGSLICDVSDSIDLTQSDRRKLRLRLYAIVGGGFVASIELSSSDSTVATVQEAENLDNMKQVEDFFYVFDPADHLCYGPQLKDTSVMISRRRQLVKLYDQLVDSVFVAMVAHRAVFPDCERQAIEDSSEPSRILKFLHLG